MFATHPQLPSFLPFNELAYILLVHVRNFSCIAIVLGQVYFLKLKKQENKILYIAYLFTTSGTLHPFAGVTFNSFCRDASFCVPFEDLPLSYLYQFW
jgi:hypothetical protein